MAKLFDKMFGNKDAGKSQGINKPVFSPIPRPKYDFVEQYTVIDPKKVFNGGYSLWELCENVPVACEESEVSPTGFISCKMLPTKIMMGFLEELYQKPANEIIDPKKRTISIVHISKNHSIVIGPNFESPKAPVFWLVADDAPKKDWILHVTPEKNRALVDALKIHTR